MFGGSLGARGINEAVKAGHPALLEAGYNLIWQTGKGNVEAVGIENSNRIKHQEYIFEMHLAYGAADLVVCRAGASSLAELSFLGKPAILIPYPFAAKDHQTKNAEAFHMAGAAEVLRDSELKEKLIPLA